MEGKARARKARRSREARDRKGRGSGMEMRENTDRQTLTLSFSGELDHHGVRDALRRIGLAIDVTLPCALILDLGGVTFMDSSGIALILRSQQKMRLNGGTALVRNVPPQARRVLEAAGISRLVSIQ